MHLLVGLGNPGPSYAKQRHNVGFMAVDEIVHRFSFAPLRNKFHGQYAEGTAGHKLLILKPQTFMNESGRSVAEAARFFKVAPADIIVIHDEIDLKAGKVRAKLGGSSAGHNGLRSIDDYIGPDYWRVRVGVGRPEAGGDVVNYVLQNFSRDDQAWLPQTLSAIAEALPILLEGDAPGFMTKVALLANPAPPKPQPKPKPKPKQPAKTGGGDDGV